MSKSKLKATIISLLVILIVAGGIAASVIERQNIEDELALIHYSAPAAVAKLATQDGMTSYTRKVFYVNHPQIDSKASFAKVCPDNEQDNAILGCYHLGQHGIFILSVNNSQLYGIEQVTAAYETLHAIYQRLSSSQQQQLNTELRTFENHDLTDPVIRAQIADFSKTEPGGVLNEMTSLFGTEVQNLTPDLKAFYSKYFTNRQALVNYYKNYEGAFLSREQQITYDTDQLTSLHTQITSDQATLKTQLATLNSIQATLQSEKSSGNTSSYDQGVPAYNQAVDAYNSLVGNLSGLVSQYNQLVTQRNSLVLEEQQLTKAITSPRYQLNNQ